MQTLKVRRQSLSLAQMHLQRLCHPPETTILKPHRVPLCKLDHSGCLGPYGLGPGVALQQLFCPGLALQPLEYHGRFWEAAEQVRQVLCCNGDRLLTGTENVRHAHAKVWCICSCQAQ